MTPKYLPPKKWLYWTWLQLIAWLKYKLTDKRLYGRRNQPDPAYCRYCHHIAPIKDWYHCYKDDLNGDVVPVDYCPECEREDG